MAGPPILRLTDGDVTVDFGGQDDSYQVLNKGFVVGDPPLVTTNRTPSLLRSSFTVVAHAHGNRPASLRFYLKAADSASVDALTNPIDRLFERARLYGERTKNFGVSPVLLIYRADSDTPITHVFRVVNGSLTLPPNYLDYPKIQGLMLDCTLQLECLPGIEEPADVVIVERTGTGSPPDGTGLPTDSSNHVTLPRLIPQMDLFGGILSWWADIEFAWDGGEIYLLDEQDNTNHRIRLRKTNTTNRLELTMVLDTGSPTTVTTYHTLNATNFKTGWHHIAIQWGDATGPVGAGTDDGMRLWLDGIASTNVNAGTNSPISETPTTAIKLINMGRRYDNGEPAVGAVDDIRIFRKYDGALLKSVPDLYATGREPNRCTVCTNLSGYNFNDGTTKGVSTITNVRGDLLPTFWQGSVLFLPAAGSIGTVRIANAIHPGVAKATVEAEACTLTTGTTNQTDAACSNGHFIRSAHGAAAGAPAAPTVVWGGTPGTTSYTYYLVAVYSGSESPPSLPTTITNGPASLSLSDVIDISWSAVPGAIGYKLLRGDNQTVINTLIVGTSYFDDGTTSTGHYTAQTGALASVASYNLILGPDWYGHYRVEACMRLPNSGATNAQIKFTQGDPSHSIDSDLIDISSMPVNVWQLINFGQFRFPIWDIPEGGRFTVTMELLDNGTTGHEVDWDFIAFYPYEDASPLFIWSPTYGLTSYERLVVQETRPYRYNGYDFSAMTGSPVKFPSLMPQTDNRLLIGYSRVTNSEYHLTDQWQLCLAYRPRYLHFRDGSGG